MAKVLICDDSAFIRNTIAKVVKELGHEVLQAGNGREGFGMILKHTPDCVLLDLVMPEMGGIQLMEALCEQGTKVPTVVITADIQQDVKDRCLQLGAISVLNKPPKREELKQMLERVLG